MDEIQVILIKAGRKDLAQRYYKKVSAGSENKELVSQLSEVVTKSRQINKLFTEIQQLVPKLDGDFGQNKRYGYSVGNNVLVAINRLKALIDSFDGAYASSIHGQPDAIAAHLKTFSEKTEKL